jgi:arylsulfatase
MEGRKGEKSRALQVYDLEQRRLIDAAITRRTIDFMTRSVRAGTPFYAYVPFTLVHFPRCRIRASRAARATAIFPIRWRRWTLTSAKSSIPSTRSASATNTLFVFTSDNGPEATWPWQGSSGPWRGFYFTHMEGSLRVPFIARWPGRIPAGRVSNEIVHEVDTFATFARLAGAAVPDDRAIDGVDQTDFLLGAEKSNREGFPVFVADRLEGVKWRNWKLVFYEEQRDWWSPPRSLACRRHST